MSRRILIVDDEQGIRAALGQLLEFEGYEVRTVANAVDGLAEYARFKPNLVFLDVKMAGIDGLEALKKLRDFKVPRGAIPRLVRQLSKGERPARISPNALPVTTPRSLGDVRVSNGKVTLYKTTGAEK